MFKCHVIRLDPTTPQVEFFKRSCGVARFSYNWALAKWKEIHESGGKRPSAYDLIKLQNSLKKTEFPWMYDVGKCAPQHAIHDLNKGYKMFFKKHCAFPKFKKRGVKDRFVAIENNAEFKVNRKKISIPKLGWVKMYEELRFEGRIINVIVKRKSNFWFVCISVDTAQSTTKRENQSIVGIDLGIKTFATMSDGKQYYAPMPLKKWVKKLSLYQRRKNRKIKHSKNYIKQNQRLSRLHYKISCIRQDSLHRITSDIVNHHGVIVIEDLKVKGMLKNKKLSSYIYDLSFASFRKKLEYKSLWSNSMLVIAPSHYPSSKLCSSCGYKKDDMPLSIREWICPSCGVSHDRDVNAAINLRKFCTDKTSGNNAYEVDKVHAVMQVVNDEVGSSSFNYSLGSTRVVIS